MNVQTELRFEIADSTVTNQVEMVLALLSDGNWWSPYEMCEAIWRTRGIRVSDAGITARTRDARKQQYGGHTISIRKRSGS